MLGIESPVTQISAEFLVLSQNVLSQNAIGASSSRTGVAGAALVNREARRRNLIVSSPGPACLVEGVGEHRRWALEVVITAGNPHPPAKLTSRRSQERQFDNSSSGRSSAPLMRVGASAAAHPLLVQLVRWQRRAEDGQNLGFVRQGGS
jgi:hypothetical protein